MSTSKHAVVRLTADQFNDWKSIQESGVVDADAKSRGRLFFDERRDGPARVFSGVWEATAHVEKITDFDKDEIMFLLQGSCTIVDDTGHTETFHPGEAFLMPLGFTGEWRQVETVRKFYLIIDHAVQKG